MLSYRHGYHAGNHADVLKHVVLTAVLEYLIQKEKPVTYVDTHAAQGVYSLQSVHAQKNKEHLQGVAMLKSCRHPLLQQYASFSDDYCYAGSVNIAQSILRPIDKIRCYELHGTDFDTLLDNTHGDKRVQCFNSDGFKGLISQVPPLSKRGAVLIDPSYELESDYPAVIATLKEAILRFATGVYMIWYPLLSKVEVQRFKKQLGNLKYQGKPLKSLHAQLQVRQPGPGMYGSCMFVINPPWSLASQMEALLPELVEKLSENQGSFEIVKTDT